MTLRDQQIIAFQNQRGAAVSVERTAHRLGHGVQKRTTSTVSVQCNLCALDLAEGTVKTVPSGEALARVLTSWPLTRDLID